MQAAARFAPTAGLFTTSYTILSRPFLKMLFTIAEARSRDLQAEETLGQIWVQLIR